MRRSWLIAWLAVAAAAARATEPCPTIAGLEPLLRPGVVLLLGEIHGTVEGPEFAGDIACHAARLGLPVVVALEQPLAGQGGVDSFLRSNGDAEARRALLAGPFWLGVHQDGRASQAMLELIARVQGLRQSGRAARVALFDPAAAGGGQARDRGMADRLAELAAAETEAVTVVLTGNLHSRTDRGRSGNEDYEPMGYLLARRAPGRVVALMQAHGGGSAWICAPECGVATLGGRRGERPWQIELGAGRPAGHDGWFRVGGITASPPARISEAERASLRRQAAAAAAVRPPEPPEPVPAAPSPQGPLSAAERSVQGSWQGYDYRGGFRTWRLDVEGRRFRAEGSGDWYEGRLVIRADRQPAWIDFVIERCDCSYEGSASEAIFARDGGSLLVAAPAPGNPRPDRLQGGGAQLMRFVAR
jgi:hypothetical protein